MFITSPHFESKAHCASLRFPKGLGAIVEQEIKLLIDSAYTPLKFKPIIIASANSVEIQNISLRSMTELCMRATTVKDMILQLGTSKLQYEHEIQKIVKKITWDKLLPKGAELALRVSTSKSRLYHSGLVEESFIKTLKSLGYRFGEKNKSFTTIDIRLKENIVSLGLSLSGRSLNQRNYRNELSHKAPLNECLAACCIDIADNILDYKSEIKDLDLHIPFAGTGTFGFEALLHYLNIAPCLYRDQYALENLAFCSPSSISHTRKKAISAINASKINLFYSDNDRKVLKNLTTYVEQFNNKLELKSHSIEIKEIDFLNEKNNLIKKKDTCLLINPPYGERLKNTEKFFKKLALKLKSDYSAHDANVWGVCLVPAGQPAELFVKNLQAVKSESTKISNGGLAIEAVAFRY